MSVGGGICSKCFSKIEKDQNNKPICLYCSKKLIEDHIEFLTKALGKVATQKIFWTIALVIGALMIFLGFASQGKGDGHVLTFIGILVWAIPGAINRMNAEEERVANLSQKEAMREAIRNEKDSSSLGGVIGIVLGKLIIWTVRGVFFPIFYTLFMINGKKQIESEIKEANEGLEICQKRIEELKNS